MCEPMTLAIAATVAATAAAGVSGYSAYSQQKYRSKVAKANSKMESARVTGEIDRGREERRNLSRRYAALSGEQRAAFAANGIDAEFGSAGDVLGDSAMIYGDDLATSSANTRDRVRGIDISAANYMAESRAASSAATGTALSTAFDMGSTVLGGVGRVNKMKAAQAGGGSGWSAF